MTTVENIEKLILTTEIQDKIVHSSIILDEKTKEAFKNLSKYTRDLLVKESKMSSSGINSLKNSLLIYWNESITPDTEKFWSELKINKIDYERKEPLRFAIDKNYFRRVEQGIDAKKHWTELKKMKEIKDNFTGNEIEQIDNIIVEDETQRHNILEKCLRKNEIPKTQYLKFGECMAYMNNCDLLNKYFSKEEVERLYKIWTNFESK